MISFYKYTTKNGLKVTYVYKPDFNKCYAGIGVKYGGCNLEYTIDGVTYIDKPGLAHFLEHKLFQMPYGDAYNEFSKLNATANAYTAPDKTMYFFSTNNDLFKPLKVLLDMYFTPYFIEEDVEKEKDIIISEIKMTDDVPLAKLDNKLFKSLYPNDYISIDVAGTIEGVKEITKDDLERAYNHFYTNDNSELVIVGNVNKDELFTFIEESTINYTNRSNNPIKAPLVSSKEVLEDFSLELNVEQTTASVGIRFELESNTSLFCDFIIGIFDCLFSPISKFYNELYSKKAFYADIDYYVVTYDTVGYAVISTTTKNPNLFLDMVKDKIQNIKVEDLDMDILDIFLRHVKSKLILKLDTTSRLGDEILSLYLENIDFFKELDELNQINVNIFKDYLKYLKFSKIIKCFCKKS